MRPAKESCGPRCDAPLFRTPLSPRKGPKTMLAVPGAVEPQGARHVLSPVEVGMRVKGGREREGGGEKR